MTIEALPADLLERVVRADNVAWYEWTVGVEKIRVSPAYAELFDLDPDNVTTRSTVEGIHPDDIAAFRAAHVAFFKGRDTRLTVEYRFTQTSGAIRWARLRALAERAASGRVTRMTGVLADITEAKEREAQNRAYAARQVASIEVLKAIAASPGDTQPVFELIARRARDLCGAAAVSIVEYDGTLMHLRVTEGFSPAAAGQYRRAFPRPAGPDSLFARTLLTNETVHVRDYDTEPAMFRAGRDVGTRSSLMVPLRRDGRVFGAIGVARFETGGFDASQVALIESFAEQASLAIAGAATLSELRARTDDLRESLEYQTATSEVLKVISRSTFDLQPILQAVAETAARLCDAEQAMVDRYENGMLEVLANFGFPPEFDAHMKERGQFPVEKDSPASSSRAIHERRAIHIEDAASVPGYSETALRLGKMRTSLAVPLLREGDPIGVIVLARQRVEPFTNRQIELVQTFADQAVIAIENTRLITEQREALEQQTATAEVLEVINASPGNLAPVFDAMLEKAMRLCGAAFGSLYTYDGERFHSGAQRGVPTAYAAYPSQ